MKNNDKTKSLSKGVWLYHLLVL